jgi:hypothetical protein
MAAVPEEQRAALRDMRIYKFYPKSEQPQE